MPTRSLWRACGLRIPLTVLSRTRGRKRQGLAFIAISSIKEFRKKKNKSQQKRLVDVAAQGLSHARRLKDIDRYCCLRAMFMLDYGQGGGT